jgi:hypothetical protein
MATLAAALEERLEAHSRATGFEVHQKIASKKYWTFWGVVNDDIAAFAEVFTSSVNAFLTKLPFNCGVCDSGESIPDEGRCKGEFTPRDLLCGGQQEWREVRMNALAYDAVADQAAGVGRWLAVRWALCERKDGTFVPGGRGDGAEGEGCEPQIEGSSEQNKVAGGPDIVLEAGRGSSGTRAAALTCVEAIGGRVE